MYQMWACRELEKLTGDMNVIASMYRTDCAPYYINFNAKPPPISSVSLSAKMPLKSAASPAITGASPRFGALGLATLLLFSWPAFEGKVGNIAGLLGFGSSLK